MQGNPGYAELPPEQWSAAAPAPDGSYAQQYYAPSYGEQPAAVLPHEDGLIYADMSGQSALYGSDPGLQFTDAYGSAPNPAYGAQPSYLPEQQYAGYPSVDNGYGAPASSMDMYGYETGPVAGQGVDGSVTGGGYAGYPGPDGTLGAALGAPSKTSWGRYLLIGAGVVLLAFALVHYSKMANKSGSKSRSSNSSVKAIGGLDDAPTESGTKAAAEKRADEAAAAEAKRAQQKRAQQARRAQQIRRAQARKRAAARKRRVAGGGAGSAARAGHAHAGSARHTVGAGARNANGRAAGSRARRANGKLPYTGAATWLIALFGVMILTTGLVVQVKASEIGETATLFQRGPLLRPVDTWYNVRDLIDDRSNLRQRLVDWVGGPARGFDWNPRH